MHAVGVKAVRGDADDQYPFPAHASRLPLEQGQDVRLARAAHRRARGA